MEAGKPMMGYVVCLTMPDGSFQGGALITDALGLPVEFRHTEPVLPSRLQRVLYGRALDTYMHNEVVIGSLLSSVEGAPQLYIVGDASYLDGAEGFGPPAVWVVEARNVPAKEVGSRQDISGEEYILQLGPGNGPIRVRMSRSVSGASATTVRDTTAKIVSEAALTMEIIEPLRRIEEALNLLWEEQQQKSRPLAA